MELLFLEPGRWRDIGESKLENVTDTRLISGRVEEYWNRNNKWAPYSAHCGAKCSWCIIVRNR